MFTLVLKGTEQFENLTFNAVLVSDTGVEIVSDPITVENNSGNVSTDENNQVTENVTIQNNQSSAVVNQGTQLEENTKELTLTVEEMDVTTSDITLEETEQMVSMNVHVNGVAADNTVPVIITLDEIAPEYLNQGNVKLYHVEDGVTVEMTRVFSLEELDEHNEFYYDKLTGTVTVAMASFSEIAVVSDTENVWNGTTDITWYTENSDATEFTICNAEDLVGLGKLVSGAVDINNDGHIVNDVNEEGSTNSSDAVDFSGTTIKLIADIDMGITNANADSKKESEPVLKAENKDALFYPIGYWAEGPGENSADETWYTYGGAFSGTFDGNGHTISNIYQNTWLLDGNYDNGYYKEAMGLFGYVYDGTVKNLTIESFVSDGEFTPTGCVAAYANGATFENIALVNCNPRVYNTGNGGIVGIGGSSSDTEERKLTFTNITIDNTNKITALWGSWDVACGGLIGMFRGAGHVYMTNCNVAAQIDVYNDVCGNYQYYWYRYSGMMIGTNKNMTTDANGYTVPETEKFHAENCTVHFGDWNDYYYCELVANSLASYTHDHQFSRLEEISRLDEIKSGDTWTKTGNFLLIEGDTKTCYHIVKDTDGTLKQHLHTEAGEETVDGATVFKEDKQIVYLPFNQLFTGYGWGVKHIPVYNGEDYAFEGITILDREVADSVVKFDKVVEDNTSYTTGTVVTIGELFKAVEQTVDPIEGANVNVTVSPVGDTSTAGGTYASNETDWTQGTLTFSGLGEAQIIITDYDFCERTVLNVTIDNRQAVEKFASKIERDYDFLYRVGNLDTFPVGVLFEEKADTNVTDANVAVTVTSETEGITGTYTANTTDWTKSTLKIDGAGLVTISITDNDYCAPTKVTVEVVAAKNAYSGTVPDATSANVVLLEDVDDNGFTVSGQYRYFYGNGFKVTCAGNGSYGTKSLNVGYVTVQKGGTLDNVKVICNTFPEAYMFTSELVESNGTYPYARPAVTISDNSTISNAYVYGARVNILVCGGNVTIKDTITDSGALANIHILSGSDYTVTLDNITTIQSLKSADFDSSKKVLGFAIAVGTTDSTSSPTIKLEGDLKQYNWVTQNDADNVTGTYSPGIVSGALAATDYQHTINDTITVNLGIVYVMESLDVNIKDNDHRANKDTIPYQLGSVDMKILGNNVTGKVYSIVNDGCAHDFSESRYNADMDNTVSGIKNVNSTYLPQMSIDPELAGQKIEKTEEGDEYCYLENGSINMMFVSGDSKELDLTDLISISKYTGQDLEKIITCTDENGNAVNVVDGKVILSSAGEYTVTYTVTDKMIYDQAGDIVAEKEYSWKLPLSVTLKDVSIPDAYFEFDTTKQLMGYYKPLFGDVKQYLPFLAGLKIYDYNGQTSDLRFDGDDVENGFNKVASVTITEYISNEAYIEIKLTDGGVINTKFLARADSSGASTYTGKIKTSGNTIYFVNDGGTGESDATTTAAYWYVDYYKFTGNNGVVIQSPQQTFNSSGSSASTPSGSFSTTINYTVTYNANEGKCGQTVGYATSVSPSVTLPTPTRSGYMFTGWYTAASGGTRVGGAGDSYTPSADITLYAQWGQPCTVTYDANGGSCDTTSAKYTGTALTLPTPTRDGYWFLGWYDAATGGNKIGDVGATYNPTKEITLYAHWQEAVKYTVTYNVNGGSCDTASATYEGTALTLPTPTKTGNKFLGWYTEVSGGTKIGDAGASYIPSANITLYAQWEKIPYTITVITKNATVNGVTDDQTAYYGDTITFTVSYNKTENQTTTIVDANGDTVATTGSYTFTMPASNVTISASSEESCLVEGTMVTMADGTKRAVEDLVVGDMIMIFNHITGEFDAMPLIFNTHSDQIEKKEYNILNLQFSNDECLRIVSSHGLFDTTLMQYVFISEDNYAEFIGHEFYALNDDGTSGEKVVLENAFVTREKTRIFCPVTYFHMNSFANGLLNTPNIPGDITGLVNYFEYDDDLKYNEEAMQRDIEEYGLYTYDDFKDYISEEAFNSSPSIHLKVAVGKGMITFEEILSVIEFLLKGSLIQ